MYINDLLIDLEQCNSSASVFGIKTGNPSLADDICCISTSPNGLQKMLDLSYVYSTKWRFNFNARKSAVLIYGPRSPLFRNQAWNWRIGSNKIPVNSSYIHLGIQQSSNLSCTDRTREACEKGRRTFFALQPSDFLNPLTVISLYKKVVIPSVLYGCELWNNIKMTDIHLLDTFQHFIVKTVQNFSRSTRSDMCESMLGIFRISSEIERRKLLFFNRLCNLDYDTLTKQLFVRRLFQYTTSSRKRMLGFVPDAVSLLRKYSLDNVVCLFLKDGVIPNKLQWKRQINTLVHARESTLLLQKNLRRP